jgi:hypothetical protein
VSTAQESTNAETAGIEQATAPVGDTVLGSAPQETAKDDANAQGNEEQATAPEVPETYELKLPDDALLGEDHLAQVTDYAKELGLSNEQAQALLERDNQHLTAYRDAQLQAFETEKASWVEAIKADQEIGGQHFDQSVELARRALAKFAAPEFATALNETGFGNHPELVRAFARIGKAMAEDSPTPPGGTAPPQRSTADVLFG